MPKDSLAVYALVILGLFAGMLALGKSWDARMAEESAACAAKGGERISTRNGDICIAKGAIIR